MNSFYYFKSIMHVCKPEQKMVMGFYSNVKLLEGQNYFQIIFHVRHRRFILKRY